LPSRRICITAGSWLPIGRSKLALAKAAHNA
jgi:hypothetical protein